MKSSLKCVLCCLNSNRVYSHTSSSVRLEEKVLDNVNDLLVVLDGCQWITSVSRIHHDDPSSSCWDIYWATLLLVNNQVTLGEDGPTGTWTVARASEDPFRVWIILVALSRRGVASGRRDLVVNSSWWQVLSWRLWLMLVGHCWCHLSRWSWSKDAGLVTNLDLQRPDRQEFVYIWSAVSHFSQQCVLSAAFCFN